MGIEPMRTNSPADLKPASLTTRTSLQNTVLVGFEPTTFRLMCL